MNDGVFVTRKTFGSVEDTLSAFYQLWMLPDMQDRANFVGYTEFDIEFEDHVSAYVRNGISEQAFCAFFHTVAENRLNRVAKEPFIKLAKNAIDVLVADEQKLLVRKTDKSRPWELLEAREVKQSHYFPLRGFQYIDPEQHPGHFTLPAITRDGEDLIPEKQIDLRYWLEFFGFWLTCGYFNTGKEDDESPKFAVGIRRRNDDDAYIIGLFKKIGYLAKIRQDGGYNCYEVCDEQLHAYMSSFGDESMRYIPEEFLALDKTNLESLLLGCEMGRVRIYDEFIVYLSTSKRVMEGMQELILKVYGSVSQIRDQYIKVKEKFVKFWYIRACTNDNIAHFLGRYQTRKLVSYTGRTYSLQLQKNHVLLVRHNDIICWCGE